MPPIDWRNSNTDSSPPPLVNEFLLVKEAGFHPLGFVMGSSIYHIGLQTRKWGESQELTKLTEAMYTARELAMTRMEEEAEELGADGVVGVRLDVNYYEWGSDSAEFIAFGTAVKAEDARRTKTPWASLHFGLVRAGFLDLVADRARAARPGNGTCVYHIAHRKLTQALGSVGQNVELPNFTQALYEARELAMTRMQDEPVSSTPAGSSCASGREVTPMGSHTIEFLSLGTAVTKTTARSPCRPRSPSFRSTTDGRSRRNLPEAAVRRFSSARSPPG